MGSNAIPETDDLLRPPQSEPEPLQRLDAEHAITTTFTLKERTYQQQFADIYFLRLAKLKPAVEELAAASWENEEEDVQKVDRVLDVRQGELCWVAGTVYMDMPLKPNVLDDISKDHWIAAPPSREKFTSPGNDQVMLEDESGRIRLSGRVIEGEMLVTGCVLAVKGYENVGGDFEVRDVLYPGLPPQIPLKGKKSNGGKYVAIVSGLGISGELHESFETHLLVEYLLGELTGVQDQISTSKITRLILAGNSLSDSAPLSTTREATSGSSGNKAKSKKYGYDSSAYNPLPIQALDNLLSSLLPSIPIDLMPGDTDPANVSLPQQPIHPAMLPQSKPYIGTTFNSVTNPYESSIDGISFLGTSGQTIDDIYKYVEGDDRLSMMERTLRWRNVAPTCPDTLWGYPFQNVDPFVIESCPHVYFVGNQPRFETTIVEGLEGQRCRAISVPRFSEKGEVVLVDLETLECEVVRICVESVERE